MLNRPIKAISILRLYIGLSGIIVACVMVRLLDRPEHQGFQMGFLIAMFSAMALADTVINDLLPESYVYENAKRWRNIGFMLLALCYSGCLFFVLQYQDPPVLLVGRLILDAVASAVVAFAGLGEVIEENHSKPKPRTGSRNKPLA